MKTLSGIVVSLGMPKTAVIEVTRRKKHALYKRLMKVRKRFKADINNVEVAKGDLVAMVETRPVAKDKHFKITEVLRKGATQ